MRVVITGATGLVGHALTPHLTAMGHRVEGFSRPSDWDPDAGSISTARLQGADAVIHLAGENIASGRWTAARKNRILNSRTKGTRLLAEALAAMEQRPKVLVSASAVGFYGDRGNTVLDEDSESGAGFLPEVCREWERATAPAQARGIRVVNLRIGIVLSADGGALRKMLTPFRLGVAGPLGDGRQYMSWITLSDLCRAANHVLTTQSLTGPVNAVSPTPVTNREFTSALAKVLRRPAVLPAPRFALRLVLGELADALLASARVVPAKLLSTGFKFQDTDISMALGKNVS
jgi:hypothetical protein